MNHKDEAQVVFLKGNSADFTHEAELLSSGGAFLKCVHLLLGLTQHLTFLNLACGV